jgi:D-glycero-D-manno-heptose 1,7-bisphosphate phosphatase
MKKALFLDRDGVIIKEKNYLYKIEHVEFINGVFEQLKLFENRGYLLIVITNQGGIARGYYSEDDFNKVTKWMVNEFHIHGVNITKVYYSPYHPDYNVNIFKSYEEDRKPNPGMIIRAKNEFNIDLSNSIVVGDKEIDVLAGKNAGVRSNILVRSGHKIDEDNSSADMIINDISCLYTSLIEEEGDI